MQNAEPINALNLQHIRNDRIQIHNGLNVDFKKQSHCYAVLVMWC